MQDILLHPQLIINIQYMHTNSAQGELEVVYLNSVFFNAISTSTFKINIHFNKHVKQLIFSMCFYPNSGLGNEIRSTLWSTLTLDKQMME